MGRPFCFAFFIEKSLQEDLKIMSFTKKDSNVEHSGKEIIVVSIRIDKYDVS